VSGLWSIGGEVRVVFSFWKICSQSSVHVNRVDFFRSWTMGWVCSASLGRKREMAVRRPMRRWTSLMVVGLCISIMALHFFGIGFYAALGQHKPKKFTTADAEYTLVKVEAKVVLA